MCSSQILNHKLDYHSTLTWSRRLIMHTVLSWPPQWRASSSCKQSRALTDWWYYIMSRYYCYPFFFAVCLMSRKIVGSSITGAIFGDRSCQGFGLGAWMRFDLSPAGSMIWSHLHLWVCMSVAYDWRHDFSIITVARVAMLSFLLCVRVIVQNSNRIKISYIAFFSSAPYAEAMVTYSLLADARMFRLFSLQLG